MREVRLGDIIDDFCVKCKRIMNHSVVSMLGKDPAKVRCRTCYSDHDYRHEQAPPPKVDSRKAALFNQVLAKLQPDAVTAEPVAPHAEDDSLELDAESHPDADLMEGDSMMETDPLLEADLPIEADPSVAADPPLAVAASKAKVKAKPKAKKKK